MIVDDVEGCKEVQYKGSDVVEWRLVGLERFG